MILPVRALGPFVCFTPLARRLGTLARRIFGCGSNPCCRGPPPLLQTFVAGPLFQTLVADLCVEYCSLQGPCRGGACRRTPPSVTNLCREMAAQARYNANVFDSLPFKSLALGFETGLEILQPGTSCGGGSSNPIQSLSLDSVSLMSASEWMSKT